MFHSESGWTKKNELEKVKGGGIIGEEKIIRKKEVKQVSVA